METLTDAEIRAERGGPSEVHARTMRKAAETRAGRKHTDAVSKAFEFFGSTDVEQAARSNAITRADAERDASFAKATTRYRERIAAAINARAKAEASP